MGIFAGKIFAIFSPHFMNKVINKLMIVLFQTAKLFKLKSQDSQLFVIKKKNFKKY